MHYPLVMLWEWITILIHIIEIASGCMQYLNLQIRYIVDQTPRETGSDHVALRGLAHCHR